MPSDCVEMRCRSARSRSAFSASEAYCSAVWRAVLASAGSLIRSAIAEQSCALARRCAGSDMAFPFVIWLESTHCSRRTRGLLRLTKDQPPRLCTVPHILGFAASSRRVGGLDARFLDRSFHGSVSDGPLCKAVGGYSLNLLANSRYHVGAPLPPKGGLP